jgi:flagellar hook-associated protein 3 FlgL
MVTNNTLLSLNRNRLSLSKYEQQLSTGKKIQKPSEDPIIAVRAIKLRSSVKEIQQYQSNIKDAISWMNVTEQAMLNTVDIMKKISELSVAGSSGTYGPGEKEKIAQELEQLKIQIQQEGNVNYAGRFVFSGYKTDNSLVFGEDTTASYTITQGLTKDQIETKKYFTDATPPDEIEYFRLRLAYEDLDLQGPVDFGGQPLVEVDTLEDIDFENLDTLNNVYFVKETGELIFNGTTRDNLVPDAAPDPEMNITYVKNGFKKNDLKPEHYFDCINNTTGVTYEAPTDEITYQMSYNQDIKVNTLGKDFITHDLIRDLEELIAATRAEDDPNEERQALIDDQIGKMFGSLITKIDNHMKKTLTHVAELGSRINRMELTANRLANDEINFTELMSKNEDVDIAETVIRMSSQEVVYNASLMASSKILQPTLLDFIR